MTLTPSTLRRSSLLAAVALTAALGLAACGGSDGGGGGGSDKDPATALSDAKKAFDDAGSLHFTMTSDAHPSGDAVLGAEGDLTDQPAFDGQVTVQYLGKHDIPVVSVDGKVYAKLPFTAGFAPIDPSDFSAPDPADFIDPAKGISGLLTELAGLKQDGQKREGKQIVTTYSGTLGGDKVAPIIPSASADATYKVVVGIADDTLTTLDITGDFFDDSSDVTYQLVFEDYGKVDKISAP